MDPLLAVIVVGLAGLSLLPPLAIAVLHRRFARERVALWREAADQAGLCLSGAEVSTEGLTGSIGSLLVRLSNYGAEEARGTRLEITSPRLAPGLTLRPEGPAAPFGWRNRKEIEIGDEEFDRLVSVQGPPALALALLAPDIRGTFRALFRGRLQVRGHRPLWASGRLEDGVLRVDVPERSVARPSLRFRGLGEVLIGPSEAQPAGDTYLDGEYTLPMVLRAAIDLATRLLAPEDLARRIADNQAGEAEPHMRLQALLTLMREFPEHPATPDAVRAAREDPDAEVRVQAGIALGTEGRDVLLGVAGGEGAEDVTSAKAVAALDASLTSGQAAELLKNALRTRRLATASACLGSLGRQGSAATQTLAKVLLVERGELGEAAAEALAATDDPSAEAPLLRALEEGSSGLRRAAAAALGRVGTRDAVAPLREAEATDASLRAAARQAVAQIHARLAGAAQGQLSLAGAESGQLSLTDDESGRLSLSDAAGTTPPGRPR